MHSTTARASTGNDITGSYQITAEPGNGRSLFRRPGYNGSAIMEGGINVNAITHSGRRSLKGQTTSATLRTKTGLVRQRESSVTSQ